MIYVRKILTSKRACSTRIASIEENFINNIIPRHTRIKYNYIIKHHQPRNARARPSSQIQKLSTALPEFYSMTSKKDLQAS